MTKLPHDGLIQIHAYLDPGNVWIMGHQDEANNGYGSAVLRSRNRVNDRTTMWSPYYRNDTQFQLRWAEDPSLYLAWGFKGDALRLTGETTFINGPSQAITLFTIDDLDPSPWFALNNFDKSKVADVRQEQMYDGSNVICFPWNGGGNQRWRYETVH